MLIVTMSTIPSRFGLLSQTIDSILNQTVKADAIELYIPKTYRRFPKYEGELPSLPKGVNIIIVDKDLGPATKVLPAVHRYKDQDVDLLYCDDDRICPPDWIASFLAARDKKPNVAIASAGWEVSNLGIYYNSSLQPRAKALRSRWDYMYRVRRLKQIYLELKLGKKIPKPRRSYNYRKSGFIDIMEGYGGVLVKPSMFDSSCFCIPDELWMVDDIWLSGCMAKLGTGVWAEAKLPVPEEQHDIADPLYESNINGMDRHKANLECAIYMQNNFGIW